MVRVCSCRLCSRVSPRTSPSFYTASAAAEGRRPRHSRVSSWWPERRVCSTLSRRCRAPPCAGPSLRDSPSIWVPALAPPRHEGQDLGTTSHRRRAQPRHARAGGDPRGRAELGPTENPARAKLRQVSRARTMDGTNRWRALAGCFVCTATLVGGCSSDPSNEPAGQAGQGGQAASQTGNGEAGSSQAAGSAGVAPGGNASAGTAGNAGSPSLATPAVLAALEPMKAAARERRQRRAPIGPCSASCVRSKPRSASCSCSTPHHQPFRSRSTTAPIPGSPIPS